MGIDAKKMKQQSEGKKDLKVGQGFAEARGDIEGNSEIPKHEGLNVDNDPAVQRAKTKARKVEKSGQEGIH